MIQPQHMPTDKYVVVMLLLLLLLPLLLVFLLRIQLHLCQQKLTESKEKTKFLERKIVKEKLLK